MPNKQSVEPCLVCAKVIIGHPYTYATAKHLPICSGRPCSENWDALTFVDRLNWLEYPQEKRVALLAEIHTTKTASKSTGGIANVSVVGAEQLPAVA